MMLQLTPVIAVLILVVMEEGQRLTSRDIKDGAACLNPCCNGRGSKTGTVGFEVPNAES